MNDSLFVSGVKRVGDFDGKSQEDIGLHWAIADTVFKCHPIEILHNDERPLVFLSDLVDSANVRMVQCGGSLGFALKAAESLGVLGDIVGQELECDKAPKDGVLRFVDNAHPS